MDGIPVYIPSSGDVMHDLMEGRSSAGWRVSSREGAIDNCRMS